MSKLDDKTVRRHLRGINAMIVFLRDTYDMPPAETDPELDNYLASIDNRMLREKFRKAVERLKQTLRNPTNDQA